MDSKGLITSNRDKNNLENHKQDFTHQHEEIKDLQKIVSSIKPNFLIGVSGVANAFTKEVIEEMCLINERPSIFALSNPTEYSECTAEDAYKYSNGKALFVSGSPFPPYNHNGKTLISGQGKLFFFFIINR